MSGIIDIVWPLSGYFNNYNNDWYDDSTKNYYRLNSGFIYPDDINQIISSLKNIYNAETSPASEYPSIEDISSKISSYNDLPDQVKNLEASSSNISTKIENHSSLTAIHVSSVNDINKWNSMYNKSNMVYTINSLYGDLTFSLNNIASNTQITSYVNNEQCTSIDDFNTHNTNTNIHVTETDKTNWENKIDQGKCVASVTTDIKYHVAGAVNIDKYDLASAIYNLNTLTNKIQIKNSNEPCKTDTTTNTITISSTFKLIPIGTITWWFGTISNIPISWHLCDGSKIDPAEGQDLIDKLKELNPESDRMLS